MEMKDENKTPGAHSKSLGGLTGTISWGPTKTQLLFKPFGHRNGRNIPWEERRSYRAYDPRPGFETPESAHSWSRVTLRPMRRKCQVKGPGG